MNAFLSFVKGFTHLSDASETALESVLQRLDLPKGHDLLHPGAVCHYFYFIEKGLTRTYYIKDGKDVTDWISAENAIAVSIISFLTHEPDRRGIQLLEDSTLWAISYSNLERLYQQYPDIDRLGRLLLSQGIIQLQQRFDDLHFATAHDRYRQLLSANPSLINRVPLGIIASWLGITQETLSRIRSQG
ncbi:MAG: Crp/Fnr family transcriptional regulator [Bacteroidetes bacterium]|nr:Crp/Fnr family transcriptional regulator [Bacteroidota bacterium]